MYKLDTCDINENMGFSTFKSSPKNLIQSLDIGPGQIQIQHLDPGLFSEIRGVALHSHSGTKSRRIKIQELDGYFPVSGFIMYSSDGTKKYQVTINSGTNAFVLTQI